MFRGALFFAALSALLGAGNVEATTGIATFYSMEGIPGACGATYPDSDFYVSLNPTAYANGANCDRTISVTYQGKTTQVFVADECPTCSAPGGIDLSPGAFQFFAPLADGLLNDVEWDYV